MPNEKTVSGWKKWCHISLGLTTGFFVIGWPLLSFATALTAKALALKLFGVTLFAFATAWSPPVQALVISLIFAAVAGVFLGLLTAGFASGWYLARACLSGSECIDYEFDEDAIPPAEDEPHEKKMHQELRNTASGTMDPSPGVNDTGEETILTDDPDITFYDSLSTSR